MCRLLMNLFCCCFVDRKANKMKRKKTMKCSPKTYARYGTNWQTLVQKVKMTASEIEDSKISREVQIDSHLKFVDSLEVTKYVIVKEGLASEKDNNIVFVGNGAFGEVFKFRDNNNGEFRAIKIMSLISSGELSAGRFDSFNKEVNTLSKTSHKNIVRMYHHFFVLSPPMSFIIMEFANRGDLRERLNQRYKKTKKPFPESEAKTYFVQIANAIEFVHSIGIAHGDLKIDNVLITKTKDGKEVIKMSDFGCSTVALRRGTGVLKVEEALGTIIYMAPEQIRTYLTVTLKQADLLARKTCSYNPLRADVWSLGVCLYRMLFYVEPFRYDSNEPVPSLVMMLNKMRAGFQQPKQLSISISKECKDLLSCLLEYDKNKRIDMKIAKTNMDWTRTTQSPESGKDTPAID